MQLRQLACGAANITAGHLMDQIYRDRLAQREGPWCSASYIAELLGIDLTGDPSLAGAFRAWAAAFMGLEQVERSRGNGLEVRCSAEERAKFFPLRADADRCALLSHQGRSPRSKASARNANHHQSSHPKAIERIGHHVHDQSGGDPARWPKSQQRDVRRNGKLRMQRVESHAAPARNENGIG